MDPATDGVSQKGDLPFWCKYAMCVKLGVSVWFHSTRFLKMQQLNIQIILMIKPNNGGTAPRFKIGYHIPVSSISGIAPRFIMYGTII